jgi:SAM-dependent methyltransferase
MTDFIKDFVKTLEFPFCYYAYIIDREGLMDYFHYGLYETGTGGLKEAQENLASKLKSLIPEDVKRILDVGCGLGRTTRDLAASGYDVIGISPDIRLMEMGRIRFSECALRLVTSSFEAYRSKDLFDLILFQESGQYIKDIRFLFSHCAELLTKTGCVLMCDEVRYENYECFHEKEAIVQAAMNTGFKIVLNENITKAVLETRNFALRFFAENKDSIISEFSPIRENVVQEIESIITEWKTGSSLFEKNILGYEIFLFQKADLRQ